jgi:predicted RecB family endonuclease
VKLVEAYADPNIAGAVGLHGEAMVLEAYARHQFVMRGRNTSAYSGKEWKGTGHNMDFIFERDGLVYGVEVKNALGYMDQDELRAKIRICQFSGIRPVFVCRMLPKPWIREIIDAGGFGLILKWQLYPWTHKELAKRVAGELGLPVDAPRAIGEGAMRRFLEWHQKFV